MSNKIYVFCNDCAPEWHPIVALADDGEVLGSHICSHHLFAEQDMMTRKDRVEHYRAKYPEGYEIEWVEDVDTHDGWQAAYKLNQETKLRRELEEAQTGNGS